MKRLDSVLSSCAVGTRSEVKVLIKKGKVTVDGKIIKDPSLQISSEAEITVDGVLIDTSEYVYLMLNKPCGFVCTTDDKERNVLEFVPSELFRKGMFPVGRLDKDTSGLILLTNDGDFSHRLTSPTHKVEKEYIACLQHPIEHSCVEMFERGMTLKDGFETGPSKIEVVDEKTARVIICEGKYHQIRRMFACCGNYVTSLRRVRIGNLFLDGNLHEGEIRKLTEEEINLLKLN